MERESFEDAKVGAYLKEHFISIKLDREERPDVDKIYMAFVQSTTGGGGWPLNVFSPRSCVRSTVAPISPEVRHGRPSFLNLLEKIVEVWKTRRADINESARDVTERLRGMAAHDPDNAFPRENGNCTGPASRS